MECSIIHKFFKAVESMAQSEKIPRDYGTGDALTRAEVRFLQTVFRNPGDNAVTLAKQLGITRGAVTQTGTRLEQRGYLERYAQKGNRKERFFRLTGLGEEVQKKHESFHDEANRQICQYLRMLSLSEAETVASFLDQLAELPVCKFECVHDCTHQSIKEPK